MELLNYYKSLELLTQNIKTLSYEKIFISDALGRILAEDIIAEYNSPELPTASMDGYAIKYEDQLKHKLKIIDTNPAGHEVQSEVVSGTCIKTFTGSIMPKGADTLIPIENVEVDGDMIKITKEVPHKFSVRDIGENFEKGQLLITSGTIIDFAHIGVMAALNIAQVAVYNKPNIATLSTGSEILDIGQTQTNSAQIRSSNHLTIAAIATKYGANVRQLGVVKDDKASITHTLKEALAHNDIVVTTGGVSVGDYDFVKDVIRHELGADIVFKGVSLKPGRHIMVARKENKFIIGLPGFAYSSTVTFLLYVVPVIRAMMGDTKAPFEIVEAKLNDGFVKRSPFTEFTACNLDYKDGEYRVDFEGKKIGSSGILTNMLGNTALMVSEEEFNGHIDIGSYVKVIKI